MSRYYNDFEDFDSGSSSEELCNLDIRDLINNNFFSQIHDCYFNLLQYIDDNALPLLNKERGAHIFNRFLNLIEKTTTLNGSTNKNRDDDEWTTIN